MSGSPTVDTLVVVFGVGILLLSLVCLGTWPALLRLCTWQKPSTEDNDDNHHHDTSISCFGGRILIKAQNRHPCHVYMDYSLAYLVASAVPIFLEMVFDESKNYTFSTSLAAVAVLGGSLLSVGNLCMQWSTAVFGAPLTTVLALQASLTVVLGTSINYILEPQKTAHPNRLAMGVVCFLLAIGFASRGQTMYQEQQSSSKEDNYESDMMGMATLTTMLSTATRRADYQECGEIEIETMDSSIETQQQRHSEESLHNEEHESLSIPAGHYDRIQVGLCVATSGGVCFGFFSPAINVAVNDPFDWQQGNGGLSVATANMWFAIAFVCCSLAGNVFLVLALETQSSSNSLYAYVCESSISEKRVALLAGTLCAIGNVLQFQGGHLAGYAASDLVQAFPLVATMWDVKVFGEFRHATKHVLVLLSIMYVSYLSGIVLLAMSIAM